MSHRGSTTGCLSVHRCVRHIPFRALLQGLRKANYREGRNKEYLDGVCLWAQRMAIGGQIIKLFPRFMKPWVFSHNRKCTQDAENV